MTFYQILQISLAAAFSVMRRNVGATLGVASDLQDVMVKRFRRLLQLQVSLMKRQLKASPG